MLKTDFTVTASKWLLLFTGFFCLLFVSFSPDLVSANDRKKIHVYQNESKVLQLDFQFIEYALGQPGIADCVVMYNEAGSAELVINGIQEGITNLIFWDVSGNKAAEYEIVVGTRNMGGKLREVKEILGEAEGIKVEIMGNKIVIKGEVIALTDMAKINDLAEKDPNVLSTARLSPAAIRVLVRTVQSFAGEKSQIDVDAVGQTLVLKGWSYGKGSAARIEKFAKVYHKNIVNLIEEREVGIDPRQGKMIQVYAHFLEVKKNAIKAYGAQWTPLSSVSASGSYGESRSWSGGGDAVTSGSVSGGISGFISNILPRFTSARDRSFGRILKVSSLSVKSGESASFHSGGEVAVPTSDGAGGVVISFKQYGMTLSVLPVAQGEDIALKIKVKVNYPLSDGFNFSLSEVETVQYCKSGNSIALAGIIDHVDRKAFDASPGTSGDALFEFFRSAQFQKEESELVIVITPEILSEAKDANIELKREVLESFDAYEPLSR